MLGCHRESASAVVVRMLHRTPEGCEMVATAGLADILRGGRAGATRHRSYRPIGEGRPGLGSVESLAEVVDEVVGGFDPDGQADQGRRHFEG